MNKLKLYTKNNKIKKTAILASASSLLFTGLRMMANPYAAAGTFILYQSPDLREYLYNAVVGPDDEADEEIDPKKIEAEFESFLDNFKIKYDEFSKKLSEDEELISLHAIICAKIAMKEDSSYEENSLDSKFKEKYNLFILKAFKQNVLTEFTSNLNDSEKAQFDQMKVNFKNKLLGCSEESFSDIVKEGAGTESLIKEFESEEEVTKGKLTQARTAEVDPTDERMSTYQRNRMEAKRIMRQMDQKMRAEEAEGRLLDVTRPDDLRLDGSRIADNLNWYIRLEQKIEDDGSGFFGMYNKFKKLPIFSFVRAQSEKGEFTKGSRQVRRRYSSILMSKRDSKYRTEIFEAPEYDVYPYYIKQRILILKFLKNELGSKFDSIYNEKMNEIESSNYADDGELSVMPNKLAKSLNRIIKSAKVTGAYVENANKFLTYFTNLLNKQYATEANANEALSELKSFPEQKWGGSAFGNSGKQIGEEYSSNKPEYDNVMNIFKSVFQKDFKRVPFGSFVKFITGTSSYDEKDNDNTSELLKVLSKLKSLLETEDVQTIKNLSDNPEPTQARIADVDPTDEIKTIDKNYSERALRMAMNTPGYVEGSVRKVPVETNLKNIGIVTIDSIPYVSKWNGSKEVIRYEQVKGDSSNNYRTMRGGSYYYWVGLIKVSSGGTEEVKNVFMTNNPKEGGQIDVVVDDLPGKAVSRTLTGIFIDTSSMFGARTQGGDAKRTFLESYSYENPAYKAQENQLRKELLKNSVRSIAYPIHLEKAMLVGGKPYTLPKGKKLKIGDKKIGLNETYYFEAGKIYTAKGGFDLGRSNPFGNINITSEDVGDFLGEINKSLAQMSVGHYANPGILNYLDRNEQNIYLKYLALYGFVVTNKGYLITKENADRSRDTFEEKLKAFYEAAKARSKE